MNHLRTVTESAVCVSLHVNLSNQVTAPYFGSYFAARKLYQSVGYWTSYYNLFFNFFIFSDILTDPLKI